MARKSMTGQLNMFDLWKELDDTPMGEVEMVSLMPWDEPKAADESKAADEPEEVVESEEVEVKSVEVENAPPVEESPEEAEPLQVEDIPEEAEPPQPEGIPEEVEVSQMEDKIDKKPRKREKKVVKERPAMRRLYEVDGKQIEIAYINYNKVRITREGEAPEVKVFENSKDAVDYYVQKMQELEPEE